MLADKVETSLNVLRHVLEDHGPAKSAVAWTAGKDSTVVLWLWRSVLLEAGRAPVLAVNLDTGLKFPEIISLRDQLASQWDVDLHVQRPDVDLQTYPVAANKLQCCRDLKILPLQQALRRLSVTALLTGLRRDEHPDRSRRIVWEPRENPEHMQVNPILEWTEMDVWAFIAEHDLPSCALYERGFRSLGCMPCTRDAEPTGDVGERCGRDQDKERLMGALRSLGYF